MAFEELPLDLTKDRIDQNLNTSPCNQLSYYMSGRTD